MREQLLQKIRSDVSTLLGKPTEALDPPTLYTLIQGSIDSERQARLEAKGCGSTLVLNGLLAAERDMRTKIFGIPEEPIKPAF